MLKVNLVCELTEIVTNVAHRIVHTVRWMNAGSCVDVCCILSRIVSCLHCTSLVTSLAVLDIEHWMFRHRRLPTLVVPGQLAEDRQCSFQCSVPGSEFEVHALVIDLRLCSICTLLW